MSQNFFIKTSNLFNTILVSLFFLFLIANTDVNRAYGQGKQKDGWSVPTLVKKYIKEEKDRLNGIRKGRVPYNSKPNAQNQLEAYKQIKPILSDSNCAEGKKLKALEIGIEFFPKQIDNELILLAKNSSQTKVSIPAIRLLSLKRETKIIPILEELLSSKNPKLVSAAIDGLGIIRKPAFPISNRSEHGFRNLTLESLPSTPIHVTFLEPYIRRSPKYKIKINPLDEKIRLKIERLLVTTTDNKIRQAASRFLLTWPPKKYQLRLAEWGVWIADGENLTLVKSVLDEIPGFVHRTQRAPNALDNRINKMIFITKPIIHLTTNSTLVADVRVFLNQGRPWFAYPRPDDYDFLATTLLNRWNPSTGKVKKHGKNPLETLFPTESANDIETHTGYPWLNPGFLVSGRTSEGMSFGGRDVPGSMGLRWQNLVLSRKPLPGTKPPKVDAKYSWWKDLRSVPSSWVTSLGETERFLYYDGPTKIKPPMSVKLKNDSLHIVPNKNYPDDSAVSDQDLSREVKSIQFPSSNNQPSLPTTVGFYVDVKNQIPTLSVVSYSKLGGLVELKQLERRYSGKEASQHFLNHLIKIGLTKKEAVGLQDSWKHQFFQTDGRRFLMFLNRKQYDTFCPIGVRPSPTESVRVGIILTEFDGKLKPAKTKTLYSKPPTFQIVPTDPKKDHTKALYGAKDKRLARQ